MSIEAKYQRSRMADLLPEPGELVERDIDALPHLLYEMAEAYPEIGMPHLQPGMYVYGLVTERIIQATKNGEFDDNPKMNQNMLTFADQHVQATYDLLHGNLDDDNEWNYAYHLSNPEEIPMAVASRIFYVTHTGRDLWRTQKITGTVPELHETDYFAVDDHLRQVGQLAVKDILEMPKPLEKLRIPEMGLAMTISTVIKRRKRVMQKYKKYFYSINQGPLAIAHIEDSLRKRTEWDNASFNKLAAPALYMTMREPAHFQASLRSKVLNSGNK